MMDLYPSNDPRATWGPMLLGISLIGLILVLSVLAASAKGFKPTPLPYSCTQVQWAFTHFTQAHLLQIAHTMGIVVTATQRRQAMACMGGRHGKG